MAEYELIQQRNISGRGVLRVPTDVRKNRSFVLYASVFRTPLNPYLNLNYNPPRGRYGTLVFLRDGYVISSEPIEYKKHVFDGVNDMSGQTLLALKCAYDGMLESVYRLSVNLSFTPGGIGLNAVNYTNGIADYVNLRLAWDECRLVCYADTAIQLTLYRLVYDVCNDNFDIDLAPPIPDPIADIPPGTPIEGIDPAYDDENDEGNTSPFPGDGPATPPPPIEGTWLLTWDDRNGNIQSGSWSGVSTDTWAIVAGANTNCSLSGNGGLVKNGTITVELEFNCNPFGFVSTLLSQTFTPS